MLKLSAEVLLASNLGMKASTNPELFTTTKANIRQERAVEIGAHGFLMIAGLLEAACFRERNCACFQARMTAEKGRGAEAPP